MLSFRPILFLFPVTLIAAGSAGVAELVVCTNQPHQTIEGFGASGAGCAQDVGNCPTATRGCVNDLSFNHEVGIGRPVYRHNHGVRAENDATICPSLWRAQSLIGADGGRDGSRDAAATHILQEAVTTGAQQVELFAVSPFVGLTKNGHAHGARPSVGATATNLALGCELDFARYLAAVVTPHDYRDGLLQLEPATKSVRATKRLRVLGHFSRFLCPGARVVDVKSPWPEVRVVGARLADAHGNAVVWVNPEHTAPEIQLLSTAGGRWRIVSANVTGLNTRPRRTARRGPWRCHHAPSDERDDVCHG